MTPCESNQIEENPQYIAGYFFIPAKNGLYLNQQKLNGSNYHSRIDVSQDMVNLKIKS